MKNKIKNAEFFLVVAFLLAIGFIFNVDSAQAALKHIGASCQRHAECISEFCGGDFVCEGTVAANGPCSITDEKMHCGPGYYCQGDTFKCTLDNRTISPPATTNPGAAGPQTNPAAPITGGSTKFTNPLQFSTVDQFLSTIMGALQKIIVSLALVMIVFGAVLYVTSAGGKQIETAKNAITAALVGLAIGIAAPSFLKEIAGILHWGTEDTRLANALSLSQISMNVLNFLLGILGILSLVMLVIGASMYLTSAGDQDRIDTGKNIFKYSLMGVIIAMSSMILVTQIAKFFTV